MLSIPSNIFGQGPYHGVLAFSQGASMAVTLSHLIYERGEYLIIAYCGQIELWLSK